jgi:putative oxidoreductase
MMRIALLVARSIMGLLFLFASITFLFKLMTPPEPTGALKIFTTGLAFLSGRFVPLAAVLISPIIVNIFFVHVFLAPEGLPVAILLVLANSFVAYSHRDSYKSLLKM